MTLALLITQEPDFKKYMHYDKQQGGDHTILFGPRWLPAPSPQDIPSPRPTCTIAKTCTWTQWPEIRIWWGLLPGWGGANAPAISGGLGQMFWEATQAQQGGWSYHPIWAVAAPCHYIHNGLKPMHVNTPCPTPIHNGQKCGSARGSPGERGGSLGPGSSGSVGVEGAHTAAISGGHEPIYVKSHLPGPRVGPPPCRPGPDAFKWPTKTPAFSAHIYSRGIIPTGLDSRIII